MTFALRVLLLEPEIAARSCEDCQRFLYHDRGPNDFGPRVERSGKPVLRLPKQKTPCAWCPKIVPGDPPEPASAQELTARNRSAYLHYLECKATGQFPADAIARRNAALIKRVEDDAEEVRGTLTQLRLLSRLRSV